MTLEIVLLAGLGLIAGSFVNALVWRVHEQEGGRKNVSIWRGRSQCPACGHTLAAGDLVPVLSWLQLKGRCRYCHRPISQQYPLVELTTAALFVLSYLFWTTDFAVPLSAFDRLELIRFWFWLPMVAGFMALFVYDLKWMILPNRIVYPLIGLAGLQWLCIWLAPNVTMDATMLRDIIASGLIGGGLFWALFQMSHGKWIGGGDVKLGFLLGLLVADPFLIWIVLFLASAIGTLVLLPLLVGGKASRSSRVPFGPFLLAAGFIMVVFGNELEAWIERTLLLS